MLNITLRTEAEKMFNFKSKDENQYIYTKKDGYDVGDVIIVGDVNYRILEMDEINQLMLIKKVSDINKDHPKEK